jgi:hypothetical protein
MVQAIQETATSTKSVQGKYGPGFARMQTRLGKKATEALRADTEASRQGAIATVHKTAMKKRAAKKQVGKKPPAKKAKTAASKKPPARTAAFSHDTKIKSVVPECPFRPGTKASKCYVQYKPGRTVSEVLKAGVPRGKIYRHWKRGVLAFE